MEIYTHLTNFILNVLDTDSSKTYFIQVEGRRRKIWEVDSRNSVAVVVFGVLQGWPYVVESELEII